MSTTKSADQLRPGRAVSKILSATRLRLEESAGTNKEAKMRTGLRKVALWLISFAALISLPAGMFCLVASGTTRTTDPDQVGLATEGVPSQAAVTFGQAIQALSVRH
jgi:hypothetical protein